MFVGLLGTVLNDATTLYRACGTVFTTDSPYSFPIPSIAGALNSARLLGWLTPTRL